MWGMRPELLESYAREGTQQRYLSEASIRQADASRHVVLYSIASTCGQNIFCRCSVLPAACQTLQKERLCHVLCVLRLSTY